MFFERCSRDITELCELHKACGLSSAREACGASGVARNAATATVPDTANATQTIVGMGNNDCEIPHVLEVAIDSYVAPGLAQSP
jgi:hypothetical protein